MRAASRVANALVAAGCRPGDRVAYLGKGTGEFFELMFGIAKAGAVIAPIQWRLATPEVVKILSDAQPRLLFVGSEQIEKVDQLCAGPDGFPRASVIAMENGGAGLKRHREWRDVHSAEDAGAVVDSRRGRAAALHFWNDWAAKRRDAQSSEYPERPARSAAHADGVE